MVEILPDTNTGMQIGRTLMVFQTRPVTRQAILVGDYLQERNEEGRKNYNKERKSAIDKRIKEKKEKKKPNLDGSFNFEAYIEEMEEEYNREERMQQQQMDHEWKMSIQNDEGFIKEQKKIEAQIFLNNNLSSPNQQKEDGVIMPREVWRAQQREVPPIENPVMQIIKQDNEIEEEEKLEIRRVQSQIIDDNNESLAERQRNE